MDIGRKIAELEARLARMEASPRLSHAALDNTSLVVRDGNGALRGLVGVQADGTTAANFVNGPPPPQPTVPVVASVLGGVTVSWDGQFADGSAVPLDWQRLEVHASTTAGFTPVPETLRSTIETPQGSTAVVVTDDPVYVRLLARNTSGTPSVPSEPAGPFGPTQVVPTDGTVTELKLADNAVTEAKIAANAVGTTALKDGAVLAENLAEAAVEVGKIANNAVTGPAIAANAVTTPKILAGAVTAEKVAAGSITTDKLTVVGGSNVLNDPSFEGPYAAAVAARFSAWTEHDLAFGNESAASLKITTNGTAQWRAVELALLPTTAGDQIYIAVDYYASTDWAGSELNVHIRWESEGAVLATDKAQTRATSPVKGGWTRLAGTYTAPATAVRARVRIETGLVTVGSTWFDNGVIRPLVPGVQIQNGAITTPKLVAGAVQAAQIDAGAVNADKIAAGAVTTEKLDALAVTADKIAANAITVGKIAAGAVDATAIAADAITGKTITGGSINGTTVTGGLIRTATTGERITLNEAGANMIVVYDSTGAAVGEFSARGVRLKGDSGARLFLDPDATYPHVRWSNAAGTNWAYAQVVEPTTGDANLELLSGAFTHGSYTDMRWRSYLGRDFSVMERLRDSASGTVIGGRLFLGPTYARFAFRNSDDPTQDASLTAQPGLVTSVGRHRIEPTAASPDSLLYLRPAAGHTGYIIRYLDPDANVYRFAVDKSGNTDIGGILTAGNVAAGRITITPTANVPTSQAVTGLNLKGTNIRVTATAATSVPGTQVTGVGVTNQSATGFTVWVTRTNNTNTVIEWIAYGT